MIRYELRCADGHGFEAWFRDSAAYDAQRGAGAVTCPHCASSEVEKALMTPRLGAGRRGDAAPAERARTAPAGAPAKGAEAPAAPPGAGPAAGPLSSGPSDAMASALSALRRKLESEADYVGRRFSETARRIHLGEEPARPVWGEATGEQARELIDEGVPVAPLPKFPRRDD